MRIKISWLSVELRQDKNKIIIEVKDMDERYRNYALSKAKIVRGGLDGWKIVSSDCVYVDWIAKCIFVFGRDVDSFDRVAFVGNSEIQAGMKMLYLKDIIESFDGLEFEQVER